VLGASLRGRLLTLLSGKSIPTKVARRAGHIDVHLVSRDRTATGGWSLVWSLAGGRSRWVQARRASAEAAALTRLAGAALRGHGDPPALLEEIRQMFGLDAVSLLERRPDGSGWDVVASAGERPPEGPSADLEVPVDATMTLGAAGAPPMERTCGCCGPARPRWWPPSAPGAWKSRTPRPPGTRLTFEAGQPCSPQPATTP
jgi:hypothetical protein